MSERYYKDGFNRGRNGSGSSTSLIDSLFQNRSEARAAQRGWEAGYRSREYSRNSRRGR